MSASRKSLPADINIEEAQHVLAKLIRKVDEVQALLHQLEGVLVQHPITLPLQSKVVAIKHGIALPFSGRRAVKSTTARKDSKASQAAALILRSSGALASDLNALAGYNIACPFLLNRLGKSRGFQWYEKGAGAKRRIYGTRIAH